MHTTGNPGVYFPGGVVPSQTRLDQQPVNSYMASLNGQPARGLVPEEDVHWQSQPPHGSHPQPTRLSLSTENVAYASSTGTFSSVTKGASHDHASARSVFDPYGSLRVAPLQQDLYPQVEPAPDCNGCGVTSAKPATENRPPQTSSISGQPLPLESHVPSSPTPSESTIKSQIALLNDRDLEKCVDIYGGFPLRNKILVLNRTKQWIANTGRKLIHVVRNEGKKGGVKYVICGQCSKHFPSIQKAGEHITSFHWRLSIWKCHSADCNKSFRRKQECDRHEESAHRKVSQKKAKRQKKAKQVRESAPALIPAAVSTDNLESQATINRSRHQRYPSTADATMSSGLSLGGRSSSQQPVGRQSLPIPRLEQTTDLRRVHSSPNLNGPHPQSLPLPPPPTPSEYPPDAPSSRHLQYGLSAPALVSPNDYSMGYGRPSMPVTGFATGNSYWTGGTDNFGGNTTSTTTPPARVQYPETQFSTNLRTDLPFPQTYQHMQPHSASSPYGGGGPPMRPSQSRYQPHLTVPNASQQYPYLQGARPPGNMRMGSPPPSSQYGNSYITYDGYTRQGP